MEFEYNVPRTVRNIHRLLFQPQFQLQFQVQRQLDTVLPDVLHTITVGHYKYRYKILYTLYEHLKIFYRAFFNTICYGIIFLNIIGYKFLTILYVYMYIRLCVSCKLQILYKILYAYMF